MVSGHQADVGAVSVPDAGEALPRRSDAAVVSTRLPFSFRRAFLARLAFLRRVREAFGRSRRHREVTARIAAGALSEARPGVSTAHRLHRCPWCGMQSAYLFAREVAYPDGALLSERWQCAHCAGDHVRRV